LIEQNRRNMRAFWKAREADPFRPKAEISNGVEIHHSTPLAVQPPALPSPEAAVVALQAARAGLARAIEERDRRKEEFGRAAIAVSAAARAISKIAADIAELGNVDGLIATWTAGCLKAAKATDPMPRDLMERREKRDALLVEQRDAEHAADLLRSDLEAVQNQLAEAQHAVAEAVAAVIDHQTEIAAIEMLRLQDGAFRIRRRLAALRDFAIAGQRYMLQGAVVAALDRDPVSWQSIPAADRDTPRRQWAAIVEALSQDSGAAIRNDDQ
jgi:hypothetical protein